jgi:hypothetical protein
MIFSLSIQLGMKGNNNGINYMEYDAIVGVLSSSIGGAIDLK